MYLESLCKIWELQKNRYFINKDKLSELGVTEEEISGMQSLGLITINPSGSYLLAPVKVLFAYGYKNLLQGNKRTAHGIFELCYQIKPKHRETCLQLLYNAITKGEYSKAYEFLYALENVSTNEHLRKDYKIYLFLLSQVSEVPSHYQEKLAAIKDNNLFLLHRKPTELQKQENVVIRLILKGKYKFAIEKLNDFLGGDYSYTVHRVIIKSLLSEIITQNEKRKSDILDKVQRKRYREILATLEEVSLTRELRTDEMNILSLVNSIIGIFETGESPTSIQIETTNVSEAIACCDYDKALELETAFLESKEIPLDKSPIYLLLVQISQNIYNINRLKENGIPTTMGDTKTTFS